MDNTTVSSVTSSVNIPPPSHPLLTGERFGNWQLDATRLTLDLVLDGQRRFTINLAEINDPVTLLDQLMQLMVKRYGTSQVVWDCLNALHTIYARNSDPIQSRQEGRPQ